MHTKKGKYILLGWSILISLLLGESIVRLFHLAPVMLDFDMRHSLQFVSNPKICYKIRPNSRAFVNSEGFRGIDIPIEKTRSEKRIIMLGDSITYGNFVPYKSSFPYILEQLIVEKTMHLDSERRYTVMNFGVGGYNIVSEVETLRVYGLKYKPDIVILNYFFNDDSRYSFNYWSYLKRPDKTLAEKKLVVEYYTSPLSVSLKRLLLQSQLFVLAWHRVHPLLMQWNDVEFTPGKTYDNNIMYEKMKELKSLGDRYNFKILCCMHPVLDYDKEPRRADYARVQKDAVDLGIPCIDLLAHYRKESPNPDFFRAQERDICHPNERGHLLIAQVLLDYLEKSHMLAF